MPPPEDLDRLRHIVEAAHEAIADLPALLPEIERLVGLIGEEAP